MRDRVYLPHVLRSLTSKRSDGNNYSSNTDVPFSSDLLPSLESLLTNFQLGEVTDW